MRQIAEVKDRVVVLRDNGTGTIQCIAEGCIVDEAVTDDGDYVFFVVWGIQPGDCEYWVAQSADHEYFQSAMAWDAAKEHWGVKCEHLFPRKGDYIEDHAQTPERKGKIFQVVKLNKFVLVRAEFLGAKTVRDRFYLVDLDYDKETQTWKHMG